MRLGHPTEAEVIIAPPDDCKHWPRRVGGRIAGPGEVLIRRAATSVNPVEWKIREGYLAKALPHHFPLIPGWDAAGTIAAVGQGLHGFHPGDAVYAYARKPEVQWGTYADFVALDARAVAFAPRGLSLEAAAALPLVGLTPWQVLFDTARLEAGNQAYVKGLGADIVVDYAAEPFAAAVRRAVPDGVDVVFDTMGGQILADSWSVLKI